MMFQQISGRQTDSLLILKEMFMVMWDRELLNNKLFKFMLENNGTDVAKKSKLKDIFLNLYLLSNLIHQPQWTNIHLACKYWILTRVKFLITKLK